MALPPLGSGRVDAERRCGAVARQQPGEQLAHTANLLAERQRTDAAEEQALLHVAARSLPAAEQRLRSIRSG